MKLPVIVSPQRFWSVPILVPDLTASPSLSASAFLSPSLSLGQGHIILFNLVVTLEGVSIDVPLQVLDSDLRDDVHGGMAQGEAGGKSATAPRRLLRAAVELLSIFSAVCFDAFFSIVATSGVENLSKISPSSFWDLYFIYFVVL